jgi:hypothetical protein
MYVLLMDDRHAHKHFNLLQSRVLQVQQLLNTLVTDTEIAEMELKVCCDRRSCSCACRNQQPI